MVVSQGEVSSVTNGSFTYITPPTVTSISPKEGTTAGGTTVKIKGTGFLTGAKVKIGGETTSVTVVSETEITAKTAAESAGEQEVEVTEGRVLQTATVKYKFAAPPTVTKVEATEGPSAGGTTVKITGTGFTSGATVKIGRKRRKLNTSRDGIQGEDGCDGCWERRSGCHDRRNQQLEVALTSRISRRRM